MPVQIIQDKEGKVSERLNRLAREEMKLRLLKDIRVDIEVCKLEGWNIKEYLNELKDIIDEFVKENKHGGLG